MPRSRHLGPTALIALLLLSCGGTHGDGAEPEPVWLRQIFVPADNLAAWPTDGDTYIPIQRDRLEKLLSGPAAGDDVLVRASKCQIRVTPAGEILGELTLDIRPGNTKAQSRKAWLPLAAANVRIVNAYDVQSRRPLVVGGAYPSGTTVPIVALEVADAGTVTIEWSAHVSRAGGGRIELPLLGVAALSKSVEATLPAAWRLDDSDEQVVLSVNRINEADRTWVVASPPIAPPLLRCVDTSLAANVTREPIRVSEDVDHRLSLAGDEVRWTATIYVSSNDRQDLEFDLPASLVAKATELDGRVVEFELTSGDGSQVLSIELPQDVAKGWHELAIDAWAPWADSRVWALPHPRSRGTFWSEGRISVSVDDDVELLDVRGVDTVADAADASGEIARLQMLTRQASCEVVVLPRYPRARGSVGHSVLLSTASTACETTVVLNSQATRMPGQLRFDVNDEWSVESIRSRNEGLVSDWHVDQSSDDGQLLVIRLDDRKLAEGDPTIIVESRYPRSARAQWLPLSALRPLECLDADLVSELLSLTSLEALDMQLSGAPESVPPGNLTTQQSSTLAEPAEGTVFDITTGLPNASVYLEDRRVEAIATVRQEVHHSPAGWQTKSVLDVRPRQGVINRIEVFFAAPVPATTRFTDADSTRQLRAELLTDEVLQRRGLPEGGQLWSIQLPEPRAVSSTVVIETPAIATQQYSAPLVTMVDAQASRPRVDLVVTSKSNVGYLPEQLRRLPNPGSVGHGGMPVLARWDYEAASLLEPGAAQPSLRFDTNELGAERPRGRVDEAILTSRYLPQLSSRHQYQCRVDVKGRTTLPIELPDGATSFRFTVDGRAPERVDDSGSVDIPVEVGASSMSVLLEFSMPTTALTHGEFVEPPWPRLGVPVAKSRWLVMTPPAIHCLPADSSERSAGQDRSPTSGFFDSFDILPTASADSHHASAGVWRTHEVVGVGQPAHRLRVGQVHSSRAIHIAVFAVAIALGYALAARPSLWLLVVAVCFAGHAVASAAIALHTTYAILGLLAAAIWRGLRQVARPRVDAGLRALPLLLIVGLLGGTARSAPPQVMNVLIPADNENEPVDERAFVSRDLLRLLADAEGQAREPAIDYVIKDVRLQLAIPAADAATADGGWNLTLDVIRPDCQVRLPLLARGIQWRPIAKVDGVPTPITQDEKGVLLTFPIAGSGVRQVALAASYRIGETDGLRQLEVMPPIAPTCRVEVTSSSELPDLLVDDKRPASQASPDGVLAAMSVVASDSFEVTWTKVGDTAVPRAATRIEQIGLLQVEMSRVTLDLRVRFEGELPDEDVKLTLNEPVEATLLQRSATSEVSIPLSISDDGHLVIPRERLPTLDVDNRELRLRLELPRRQSLGRLRLPPLAPVNLVRTRYDLGAMCDDSLDISMPQLPGGARRRDADDFLADAGLESLNPSRMKFAVDLSQATAPLVLAVAPRSSIAGYEEMIRVLCEPGLSRLRYESNQGAPSWPRSRQEFSVDPDIEITSVTASTSEGAVPLSFARTADAKLIVLYQQPIVQPYRLRIEGHRSTPDRGTLPLPQISAVDNAATTQRFVIYSSPRQLVTWESVAGLESLPQSTYTVPGDWIAYPVGVFRCTRQAREQVKLRVTSNRPRYDLTAVVRPRPASETGFVEVLSLIEVERGKLVEFAVELPDDASGPFDIDPPAYVTEQAGEDGRGRRLLLRFPQAIDADRSQLVTIRYAVASQGPTMRIELPQFSGASSARYWLATRQDDDRGGEWTVRGASEAPLPPKLAERIDPVGWTTFAVRSRNRFSAQWSISRASQAALRVALVRHSSVIDKQGRHCTTSEYIILPSQLEECPLVVPSGCELTSLTVDGDATLLESNGDGEWTFVLGPGRLPHYVVVESRSGFVDDQSVKHGTIRVPSLGGEPATGDTAVSLWRLATMDAATTWKPDIEDEVPAGDEAMLVLNQWLAASSTAPAGLASLPDDVAESWAAQWAGFIRQAEADLRSGIAARSFGPPPTVVPPRGDDEVEQLLASAAELRERLTGTIPAIDRVETAAIAPRGDVDFTTYALAGNVVELELTAPFETNWQRLSPWLGATLVVAVLVTLRRRATDQWLRAHPHVMMATAGGLFAVLLWPAWLGLLLAAATFIALARHAWETHRQPSVAS